VFSCKVNIYTYTLSLRRNSGTVVVITLTRRYVLHKPNRDD